MPSIDWEKAGIVVVLGSLVVAFIKGWIVPKTIYEHEKARAKKAAETLHVSALTLHELSRKVGED